MRYFVLPRLRNVEYCKECGEPMSPFNDCMEKPSDCGRYPQSKKKPNADEQVGARDEDDRE